MTKTILKDKYRIIIISFLAVVLFYSNSFAWGRHEERYHYRRGNWYRQGWFGFDVIVPALSIGAVVTSLPQGYTTVFVSGAPYYHHGNYYYRPYTGGYIVVPAPTAPASTVEQVNPYFLSVTKIAEMAFQNIPDSVIINEIQRTRSIYRLDSEAIGYLKLNKVSDRVIDYMMATANK